MIRRKWPIRWVLTLWYSGLLLLALLVFGAAIYFGLRHELTDNLNEQLAVQVGVAEAAIQIESGQPALIWDRSKEGADEQFIRVWDGQSNLTADSGDVFTVETLTESDVAAVLTGQDLDGRVTRDGVVFQYTAKPIRAGEQIIGVLQVALSVEDVTDTLAALRTLLLISIPVLLLIAGIGGYLLSGRVLRPVQTITAMAQEISGASLGGRVNLELPDDEMGRLAATFNAMLDRIEQAFERQRQFTGDAAHELRTPIGVMRSRVDVALLRTLTADDYRAELTRLQGDLERMSVLTANLLTLARTEQGALKPDKREIQLGPLVDTVLEVFGEQARKRSVELTSSADGVTVFADEDLLIQVLINLVDNAVRNTPDGGSVSIHAREQGQVTEIDVRDTGSGIPVPERERIFERFYRLDRGRDRASGGTGLGLSLCKSIVEAHGGTIGVVQSSEPGAIFRVVLPNE